MKEEALKKIEELKVCINQDEREAKYLEAVKRNGWAIQYIHNPSEEVQLEAVKQHGWVIQYLHSPSEEVKQIARDKGVESKYLVGKDWYWEK